MASIGWIDFSSEHREKVHTVLDLLKNKGVIDELGIGVIRDSFADRMFPGISTIQTRAKYFTLTAYLIRKFTERRGRRETLEEYLNYSERGCRIQLVEQHGEERGLGIIGSQFGTSNRRDVIRKPSSVYWNGLRIFGFITPALSLSEFSARLAQNGASLGQILKGSSDDDDEAGADLEGHQPRVTIPAPDSEYWDNLSITLTTNEARLLRQQITVRQPDSLIGQILLNDDALAQVLHLPKHSGFAEFSELPFLRDLKAPGLAAAVGQARDFWRIMYGAHIRYNCLLQEGADDSTLAEKFNDSWAEWLDDMTPFPGSWDTEFMWSLISAHGRRVALPTRRFVNDWIAEASRGCPDVDRCNELVRIQELQNKGTRARLGSTNQAGHPSKWIGLDDLIYRLPVVLQILRDIHDAEQTGGRRA